MAGVYSQLSTINKLHEAERKQQTELNQQVRAEEQLKEERENANFFERLGVTVADIFTELGGGLAKLVEGVVDAGVSIAGGIGGLFGADTKWDEDIVKFDATQEWWYSWEDDITNKSYLNDGFGNTVKEVVRGVGQQLPTIAAIVAAPFTGGASLSALPYTLGATIASAGGTGVEEALNEDASFGEAFLYGTLQAGIEGLVEYASAGMGKGITSIGKAFGKSATKTMGKVVFEEALSEAFEEGVSALVNPLTKRIYDEDALEAYKDISFYQNAAEQALVGGIVGGITAGTGAIVRTNAAGGKTNLNINESINEIEVLDRKEANLWKNGKLNANTIEDINAQRNAEIQNISDQLKSMTEADRKAAIEKYNLQKYVNEKGEIKTQINPKNNASNSQNAINAQNQAQIANVEQSSENVKNVARKPLISDNIEAYSPSLRNTELVFAPTSNNLSEAAKAAKKFVTSLNPDAKLVITDNMFENVNAFYDTENKVLYLSNNATTQEIAGHEFTHSLEGTKEYSKLANYVLSNVENVDQKIQEKIKQYQEVNKEAKSGEAGKDVALYEAQTEIVAEEMGKLLSDPKAIDRVINENKSVANRIWQWIKDAVAKLSKRGGDKTYYNYVRNAEKLYAAAIKNSVGGIGLSEVAAIAEFEKQARDQEQALAKKLKKRYNVTTNTKDGVKLSKQEYAILSQTIMLKNANSKTIKPLDFANTSNKFYVYENNGAGNFKVILEADIEADREIIKAVKEELRDGSYRKPKTIGEWTKTVQSRGRSDSRNNGISTNRGTSGNDVGLPGEKSTSNTNRNSKTAGNNNRYSLDNIDNTGNDLSENQLKFFANSKAVDKNNKLKVLYHGTPSGGFTEFARNFNYFTDSKDVASTYTSNKHVYEVYLNIENPIEIDARGEKWSMIAVDKITIKGINDVENFLKTYGASTYFEKGKLRTSTADIVSAIAEAISDNVFDADGVIINNIIDEGMFGGDKNTVANDYVSFKSNQIKNIDNKNPTKTSKDIRYSLKDTIEKDVVKEFGTTPYWSETGYLLQDGTKLDLSGKKNGARGGQRSVDHREIFNIYDDADTYGTEAMVEFMQRGNIRVSPEYPGINLQVEPTEAQYSQIRSFIEKVGLQEGAFSVDFDNKNGDTVDTLSYENNISASKIINDIKYYFREGKLPYKSELSQFRYSLKQDNKGNRLTIDQAQYFKNTKAVDKNGNLLVLYHGTGDNDFTIFDIKKSKPSGMLGQGFYFTISETEAMEKYAKKNGRVIKAYLNITNPLEVDLVHKSSVIYKLREHFKGTFDIDDYLYNAKYRDRVDTNKMLQIIKQEGYDGIINREKGYYVALDANQIKEITNKAPTINQDIRFSLKDGEGDYNYSKGQISKYVAEHSKMKAYSKTDAEKIINTVVSEHLNFGNKYGELIGKTKEEVVSKMWHALNTANEGYRAGVAMDIADYIIENAAVQDMYGDVKLDTAFEYINAVKNYLHKVDLSGIKGEIKYHYDNDNSPYAIWGKRKGVYGSSPDQIAQELAESGIFFRSNVDADIFFEMDERYRQAVKDIKAKTKEKIENIADTDEIKEVKNKIVREILVGYDETGHKTKLAETVEKYTSQISNLKKAVRDIKAYNKAKNNTISTIERLKEEFVKNRPAGWKVPQQVADFVKDIAKVETWRNNISSTARSKLKELQFHLPNVLDETQLEIYPYKEILSEIASGQGELTTEEFVMLDNILRQFAWQLRNYDQVVFEGKSQSNTDLATKAVKESQEAKEILKNGSNIFIKFKNKVYTNPYDRLATFGLYRKDSVAMKMYQDMLEGDRRRANFVKDAADLFDPFFEKNKKYLSDLQKEITLGDGENKVTMTKRQALALYSTSLREQGRSHIFNVSPDEGVIRLLDNKYSTQGKMQEAFAKGRDVRITAQMLAEIKENLTEADKEYLELTKKFFNEKSRDAKVVTDKQLYGITNIENDYYFPIKVSSDKIYTEAGQADLRTNQYILDLGVNKTIKPNASNKIVIDGIDNIVSNHIRTMSLYYGYAIPLTAYNRIMNKQVIASDGADITSNMRSEIQKIDTEFEGYMNKLWKDVQGISRGDGGFVSSLLSKIRWAGANAALGLNPKVLVTQTLSLSAGMAEFNPKYIAKGMSHFFGEAEKADMAKYSSLMWERNVAGISTDVSEIRQIGKEIGNKFGKVAAKATQTLNDITTKPISWMDSNVIQTLWFAAQYETADTMGKGYEFGTEANKIEAGKRLDEVVFRTQQTSDPIGRSEWMRSQNEIVKFARMFTGDALQLTGRLINSVNQYNMAKRMVKSNNASIAQQGKSMLQTAKTNMYKAGAAFTVNQIMLLAIAMAFKWIKGKDDDEEWSDIAKHEAIANMMGLIPFGGDLYEKLQGYEPTNMAYTALGDVVEIAENLYGGLSTLITNDYQDPTKRNAAIRKTALSMSKLFGIPTQNLESYMKGIVGKISPATKEQYDALFKTKSNAAYLEKIRKATADGDEKTANTIINIMFNSKTGKIKDDKVLEITRDLIEDGYDVLPKSVGASITYDNETYNLTKRQHDSFMKTYSQSTEKIKKLVNSYSFKLLTDEAKAKAMKFIYDYYYDLAIEDLLGEDLEEKNLLFAEAIPVEQLAMAVCQSRLFASETDKKGNAISGTKKAKVQAFIQGLRLTAVQKYMIMGYLGYSNKYGENQVKSYINSLKLTKTQKSKLYAWSGYNN